MQSNSAGRGMEDPYEKFKQANIQSSGGGSIKGEDLMKSTKNLPLLKHPISYMRSRSLDALAWEGRAQISELKKALVDQKDKTTDPKQRALIEKRIARVDKLFKRFNIKETTSPQKPAEISRNATLEHQFRNNLTEIKKSVNDVSAENPLHSAKGFADLKAFINQHHTHPENALTTLFNLAALELSDPAVKGFISNLLSQVNTNDLFDHYLEVPPNVPKDMPVSSSNYQAADDLKSMREGLQKLVDDNPNNTELSQLNESIKQREHNENPAKGLIKLFDLLTNDDPHKGPVLSNETASLIRDSSLFSNLSLMDLLEQELSNGALDGPSAEKFLKLIEKFDSNMKLSNISKLTAELLSQTDTHNGVKKSIDILSAMPNADPTHITQLRLIDHGMSDFVRISTQLSHQMSENNGIINSGKASPEQVALAKANNLVIMKRTLELYSGNSHANYLNQLAKATAIFSTTKTSINNNELNAELIRPAQRMPRHNDILTGIAKATNNSQFLRGENTNAKKGIQLAQNQADRAQVAERATVDRETTANSLEQATKMKYKGPGEYNTEIKNLETTINQVYEGRKSYLSKVEGKLVANSNIESPLRGAFVIFNRLPAEHQTRVLVQIMDMKKAKTNALRNELDGTQAMLDGKKKALNEQGLNSIQVNSNPEVVRLNESITAMAAELNFYDKAEELIINRLSDDMSNVIDDTINSVVTEIDGLSLEEIGTKASTLNKLINKMSTEQKEKFRQEMSEIEFKHTQASNALGPYTERNFKISRFFAQLEF